MKMASKILAVIMITAFIAIIGVLNASAIVYKDETVNNFTELAYYHIDQYGDSYPYYAYYKTYDSNNTMTGEVVYFFSQGAYTTASISTQVRYNSNDQRLYVYLSLSHTIKSSAVKVYTRSTASGEFIEKLDGISGSGSYGIWFVAWSGSSFPINSGSIHDTYLSMTSTNSSVKGMAYNQAIAFNVPDQNGQKLVFNYTSSWGGQDYGYYQDPNNNRYLMYRASISNGKYTDYDSWYVPYMNYIAESGPGSGGIGEEFLQNIISSIMVNIDVTNSSLTQISDTLVQQITYLEQIRGEAQQQQEATRQAAEDIINAQISNITDINNPNSLVSIFNDAFKGGYIDGLKSSENGYIFYDIDGEEIPIDSVTGEYILPLDDNGNKIIPVDYNGNPIIPLDDNGNPKNSKDIGKTDVLVQSAKNLNSYGKDTIKALNTALNELGMFFGDTGLVESLPAFVWLKMLVERFWMRIGLGLQPFFIIPLMVGTVMSILGIMIRVKRRSN